MLCVVCCLLLSYLLCGTRVVCCYALCAVRGVLFVVWCLLFCVCCVECVELVYRSVVDCVLFIVNYALLLYVVFCVCSC